MKSQDKESVNEKINDLGERFKDSKTGKVVLNTVDPFDTKEKEIRDTSGDIFTIPNLLSLIRIALVPVFMYTYIARQDYILTAVLLLISGITDVADGYIARTFHLVSNIGKALDPIADKLTQAAIMLCLVARFPNMIYPLILIFIKEITSGILGLVTIKKTGRVKGAVWHGKLTTVMIYVTMLVHLVWIHISEEVSNVLIFACCGLMLLSFTLYAIRYFSMLKAGPEETQEKPAEKESDV